MNQSEKMKYLFRNRPRQREPQGAPLAGKTKRKGKEHVEPGEGKEDTGQDIL